MRKMRIYSAMLLMLMLMLMLTATGAVQGCRKQLPTDEESMSKDTIYVNQPQVRTVNNGMSTLWTEGDALNVFHAPAGTADYSANSRFSVSNITEGKFTTTQLSGELAASNDWYVLYPYNEHITSPKKSGYITFGAKKGVAQLQEDNDNMAHIAGENYPIWGIARDIESNYVPKINMTHLTSLLKVSVKNDSEEEMVVTELSFTAPEDIVGTYYIDFSTDTPIYEASGEKYVSRTASLSVRNPSAITPGSSASFYLAIKPFSVSAGETLTLKVNGLEKTIILTEDTVFLPGKLKPLNFSYKPDIPDDPITPDEPSFDDFCLVTDADNLAVGNQIVIVAADADYAISTNQKSNNRAATPVVKNGNIVSWESSDVQILTLENGAISGTYAFSTGSGYLYAGSSSSNKLQTETSLTNNSSWDISISSGGVATIKAQGNNTRNWLRFNDNTKDNLLFSCYSSGQKDVMIYMKGDNVGGSADNGDNGGGDGNEEQGEEASGWLELPSLTGGGNYFLDTFYASGERNYTYLYDKSMYASLWTAYPLYYSTISGSGRTDWTANPNLPQSDQINIWDKSYGVAYGSTIYSRGHQIPNGDRTGNNTMQQQTFYATNSTPQIQDGFNGGIWATLEDQVRGLLPANDSDTLYVITGALFRKQGGSETINYISPQCDSKQCPVPNYYWKAVLKVKRSGSYITSAQTIGFWFEHKQYGNADFDSYTATVDEIEEWTGYDLFTNLPEGIESEAETNSSWTTFKNF